MTYTREELAAILEAARKATPGPWAFDGISYINDKARRMIGEVRGWGWLQRKGEDKAIAEQEANGALMAGAPILAAEVERQAKRIAELEAEVASPLLVTAGRMAEAIADEKALHAFLRALRDCIMNTRGPDAYRAVQEADRVLGAYEAKHGRSPTAAPGV